MSRSSTVLPPSGTMDGEMQQVEYDVRCPDGGRGYRPVVEAFLDRNRQPTVNHIDLIISSGAGHRAMIRVYPDRSGTRRDTTRDVLHIWGGICFHLDEQNEVGPPIEFIGRLTLQVTDKDIEAGKAKLSFPSTEEPL